jgi:hypothetical protein
MVALGRNRRWALAKAMEGDRTTLQPMLAYLIAKYQGSAATRRRQQAA